MDDILIIGGVPSLAGGKRLLHAGWDKEPELIVARDQWIFFDAEPLPDGGWAALCGDLSGGKQCESKVVRLGPDGAEIWSATMAITGRSVQSLPEGHLLVVGGG